MIKNSKIEVGKTPAENANGEVCDDIVDGNPVKKCCGSNNCFDKVSSIVFNIEDQNDESVSEVQDDKTSGSKPESS